MQIAPMTFTYPIQMFSAGVRNRSLKDNCVGNPRKFKSTFDANDSEASICISGWCCWLVRYLRLSDQQRNCYETNLDIANHGMGIRDGWLQFKLSQERHQWLNICHPILLCQLYHTHPQPGTNHPHPFFSVQKILAWPSASSRFIKAQHK